MKLFGYVIREYVKYVIGAVTLSIFLFILFDFIHKTTKYFARYKPTPALIAQFYIYQLPAQLVQALPIASLLGSVICMVLLSRNNEITAMRAAGMGPFRVGLPLAVGGLVLSLMALFLGEVVLPRTAEKMHFIQQVQIEGESSVEIMQGARWVRSNQTLFNFGDYDPIRNVLLRVKLIDVRGNFRPVQSLEASEAVYQAATDTWMLSNLHAVFFKANGTVDYVENKPSQEMKLPVDPKKLRRERRVSAELSVKELVGVVRRNEQSGADNLSTKVDLHVKLAFPFAAFVVSLVGLRFGYKSERTTETAKGVLLAFALGMTYFFILNAGIALGKSRAIPPPLAAWAANVLILAATAVDLWRSRRA